MLDIRQRESIPSDSGACCGPSSPRQLCSVSCYSASYRRLEMDMQDADRQPPSGDIPYTQFSRSLRISYRNG